jgi:hypothetical protein
MFEMDTFENMIETVKSFEQNPDSFTDIEFEEDA